MDLLTCDLIELPYCPGFAVALGSRWREYARLVAERATIHHTHPWVRGHLFDADLERAVREMWATIAPGWLGDVRAMHAHEGLAHHLRRAGHELLSPERAHAVRLLRERPEIAARRVTAILDFGMSARIAPLGEAIGFEHATIAEAYRFADMERYDEDETITWRTGLRAGASVAQHIADLAGVPLPELPPAPVIYGPERRPAPKGYRYDPELLRQLAAMERSGALTLGSVSWFGGTSGLARIEASGVKPCYLPPDRGDHIEVDYTGAGQVRSLREHLGSCLARHPAHAVALRAALDLATDGAIVAEGL